MASIEAIWRAIGRVQDKGYSGIGELPNKYDDAWDTLRSMLIEELERRITEIQDAHNAHNNKAQVTLGAVEMELIEAKKRIKELEAHHRAESERRMSHEAALRRISAGWSDVSECRQIAYRALDGADATSTATPQKGGE